MLCPKCGGENPGNAHVCDSCNTALIKAMTSKLAIVSLVLGMLSLFLFVLAGIPAIVVGIVSLLKIRRSNGALKGKYIALAGMNVSIVFMCIFLILWSRDAPPIPNDYTLADLRSAPAEYAESFELLKTLIDEDHNIPGAPAIGLSDGDIDMIKEIRDVLEEGTAAEIAQILSHDANDIKAAWASGQKARDTIHRLNAFPEIAVLIEPIIGYKNLRLHNLIELAHLYEVYAHLQTEPNDIHAFAVELIELHSVFRKLSLNARPFIERLVCHACIEKSIISASVIVNHPRASKNTIERLARHFTSLTGEELSLHNGVLFDYLLVKNIILEVSGQSPTKKNPLFKTNSTLRVYKNSHDSWLDAIEQKKHVSMAKLPAWPSCYPFKEPNLFRNRGLLPLTYWFYNPLGSRCLSMFGFYYDKYYKKCFILQVRDDLFRIILNKRLGEGVRLKARAYSDEYIVDVEDKKIFSPGPDGEADTEDDIKLRINPQVLGWNSQEKSNEQ